MIENTKNMEAELSRRVLLAGTAATAATVLVGCASSGDGKRRSAMTMRTAERPTIKNAEPATATTEPALVKAIPPAKWNELPAALKTALQRYGWSLPICVWPIKILAAKKG